MTRQPKSVVPGLIDAHAHMDREGLKDIYPSLAGARSIDDVLEMIRALVAGAEPGEWIVTMPIGDPPSYWDTPNNLKEKRFPDRRDLDRVAPDNPVYIRAIRGFWRHALPLVSIANTSALEIAGIGPEIRPPCDTVTIERNEDGVPSGIFTEWSYMPTVELTLIGRAVGLPRKTASRGSGGPCRPTTRVARRACSRSMAWPAKCSAHTGRCTSVAN